MMRDLLLGVAIGDAYGAGLEFIDRNWILKNVDFTSFVDQRGWAENYTVWDYTDDTEMTLGLIKALMSGEEMTPDSLLAHFKAEYERDKELKGFGRNGHGSIRHYYEGDKSIDEVRRMQSNRLYPGNAPPMRALPLGFLSEEDLLHYADINADSTHPHKKARAASGLVAYACKYVLDGGDLDSIIDYGIEKSLHWNDVETTYNLRAIKELGSPDSLKDEDITILCGPQPVKAGVVGLGADAMRTAVCTYYVLSHARSTFDGLKASINMGGDVDSLASICTGILALRYGLDSLPDYMEESVEGRNYLIKTADQFSDWLATYDEKISK